MFNVAITVHRTERKKSKTTTKETTINVPGSRPAGDLTIGEIMEGIDATEKFLSRLTGDTVTVEIQNVPESK